MHGLAEIIAMNQGEQADHTKLPGIVRDTLQRLHLWDKRILIGQVLQVLADERPDTGGRRLGEIVDKGLQKSPSELAKGPGADGMVRGATRRP